MPYSSARGLLAGDIDDLRRGRLHAECQLVGIHAGGEPVVKIAGGEVVAIEFADEIEHTSRCGR